jgi:ParB-like chromosome segregation protein Spo0J
MISLKTEHGPEGGKAMLEQWQAHPIAELFPVMSPEDLEAFTADIRAHGVREPIWLYEGKILEGRHRYRACMTLGLECPTREYTGDDPLGFVVSMNLHRRHLSQSQRALVAAKLANMRQGERTDVRPSANLQKVSQASAAALLHVSPRSVAEATRILREAPPHQVAAVEAGQRTLHRVAQDLPPRPSRPPASTARPKQAGARWHERIAEVRQHLLALNRAGLVENVARRWAPEVATGYLRELQQVIGQLQDVAMRVDTVIRERVEG